MFALYGKKFVSSCDSLNPLSGRSATQMTGMKIGRGSLAGSSTPARGWVIVITIPCAEGVAIHLMLVASTDKAFAGRVCLMTGTTNSLQWTSRGWFYRPVVLPAGGSQVAGDELFSRWSDPLSVDPFNCVPLPHGFVNRAGDAQEIIYRSRAWEVGSRGSYRPRFLPVREPGCACGARRECRRQLGYWVAGLSYRCRCCGQRGILRQSILRQRPDQPWMRRKSG